MKGQKYPQLKKQMLLEYAKSDYDVFYVLLNLIIYIEVQLDPWECVCTRNS